MIFELHNTDKKILNFFQFTQFKSKKLFGLCN